ncbi:endonuclease/exonuclease/phosphatase family protein [Nonomuraea monospora]|uniref:Endonuclease/exonuclease/phosphatase family protein n=1 Tax=Nonomuraea monospora TaxID=568818 RepID=A0ABN3D1A9_9ACTN
MLGSLAVLVAALLALHSAVPNAVGNLGSLLETFLPWLGLPAVALLALASLRRSPAAIVAAIVPALVWAVMFGAWVFPRTSPPGTSTLTVLQHNVADDNATPATTANTLARAGADLIALQELTPQTLPVYEAALTPEHPHRLFVGTIGLWSRYPITHSRPLDIKPKDITADWNRGLRATVQTPTGDIAAYVAHLPSVRIRPQDGFGTAWRDESATALGAEIAGEKLARIVLMGDLNGTVHDRGLSPLTSRLTPALDGFAFTWPAAFPLARIDHIMTRDAPATSTWTLPSTGSDHLPTAARLDLKK